MKMDLRALRYFVETVRHSSFTVAAERLNVTQSTVSKMLRQLEEEIGQPLLIRDGRQLRLTDVGRIVHERGLEALGMMGRLTREVSDLTTLVRGELTVGIPPMVNLLFPPVVKAFRERYPAVSLRLQENGGQVIEQQVASGELEVGATLLPADPALGLDSRSFGRYPVFVVGTRQARWARAATVPLTALRDEPLLLLGDDFSLTRRIREACVVAGFEARIAAQSSQWDFLVALAAAGLGTTLIPAPLLARLNIGDELLVRPLLAAPESPLDWNVALIWKPGRYMSHAARAWVKVCEEMPGSKDPVSAPARPG
ncbi:MAG: LysR family transcriptional regulator [Zoogloea sp.]|jgi:DNA-binding transcriptional LysR family regulator|nr:LysR family transcriptional regulator [Zoogloea sp.]